MHLWLDWGLLPKMCRINYKKTAWKLKEWIPEMMGRENPGISRSPLLANKNYFMCIPLKTNMESENDAFFPKKKISGLFQEFIFKFHVRTTDW